MRNIASKIFGKKGKYIQRLNSITNLTAIPITPPKQITMNSKDQLILLTRSLFILSRKDFRIISAIIPAL